MLSASTRFEILLTSKWSKMYTYWKYSANTKLIMYANQVMVPYCKPGQIPTKRSPISTEVLMEVARIISHGIGPRRRFLVKGKTIIVRTSLLEIKHWVSTSYNSGCLCQATICCPFVDRYQSIAITRALTVPDATKKETLHFYDDYGLLQRRKSIIRATYWKLQGGGRKLFI